MKVMLVPYPDTWLIEGGHRTQQSETANALRRLGVDVEIGDVDSAPDADVDIVHFFGDPRPLLARGRLRGRLVVSPVHWPSSVELGPVYWRGGRGAVLHKRLRHRLSSLRHPRATRRRRDEFRARLDAIASADLVITNSHAESALLAADSARRAQEAPLAQALAHERRGVLGDRRERPRQVCLGGGARKGERTPAGVTDPGGALRASEIGPLRLTRDDDCTGPNDGELLDGD